MKYLKIIVSCFLWCLVLVTSIYSQSSKEVSRPNIILIMADDLGYGDLGAYNKDVDFTPNIDRLSEEGMRFTDYHSNGPMCSPTRAALMTGMYQQRLGERFEGALSAKRKDRGMPLETITLAEMLKKKGYSTGLYGKWHLGYEEPYLPNNYGFDEFRGLLSGDGDHHTHINRWGKKDWWHNKQINMEEGYSVDLITKHSTNFIEQNSNKPFFLYVSHLAIHFPWQGPEDPPHRKAGKSYGDDKWGIIDDSDNVRPHVTSMIKAIDQSLEKIIEKLEQHNLTRNTLVIFTSDNGGYTHYYQGEHQFERISDNGRLRGQKTQVYEGGHRVPFIAYWPGQIPPGAETDETAMTMDLFPTFANLVNAEIPESKKIDGRNILPVLLENKSLPERYLYWKIGDEWAARKGQWKLLKNDKGDKSLFNLKKDISEKNDFSSKYPNQVKELNRHFQEWKEEVSSYAEKWDNN